ncbi:MAG: protein TolR [Candidatus Dadabacteria bacterium]|nr:MAG: protein TolR [Candidatus Dadabacteria bacterium]
MASADFDREPLIANINVTPLVDVMLVLLVIFMITAPILQQGVEVNLPKATTAPVSGSGEQVVVSINAKGEVFIGGGNRISLPDLGNKIKAILERRREEDRKVYIKADRDVLYGRVMEVMGVIHRAGVLHIGLVSEPEDNK